MTTFDYRGYGLRIQSDFELPEYQLDEDTGPPEIRIHLDPCVATLWEEGFEEGAFHTARAGGFVLRVPEIAVYHVTDGTTIRVAPDSGADPGMVRLFTIGSAMGMALHQREALVLHGATVASGGKARILLGESGTGKSTLAARLGQAGCAVLGDDTMALWPPPPGRPGRWLWQGSQVFKLWEDSIQAMGLPIDGLDRLGNRADKFYVPNPGPEEIGSGGVELSEILVLEEDDAPPRIEKLTGFAALQVIAAHTYRREYVALMGRETAHFRQCGDLARDLPVGILYRPWGSEAFDQTVEFLAERWSRAASPSDDG